MKPLIMPRKRAAIYVPYRRSGSGYEFFLQKRDGNAPTDPNILSLFGGGVEKGETLAETLRREIWEELQYRAKKPLYFARFQRAGTIFHVFIEEVLAGFENQVTVSEGEYGKFLDTNGIIHSSDVSVLAQLVVADVTKYLSSQK